MNNILKIIKNNKLISFITVVVIFIFTAVTSVASFAQSWDDLIDLIYKEKYNMKIELIDINDNIHVNSVTNRKKPYISSIGSWYKFRLTNTGKETYSLIKVLYEKEESIFSFQKYYLKKDLINLSNKLEFPKQIEPKESIEIYIFIPLKVNQKLGRKLFSVLHDYDKKLDTRIELYLYGETPLSPKTPVPVYNQDGKFIRVMHIDVKIMNWDEYFALRNLFKDLDYEKGMMQFENNMHDGFIYMNKHHLLAKVIKPKLEESNLQCVDSAETNNITIAFETNSDMSFSKKLFIDSTCLQLSEQK